MHTRRQCQHFGGVWKAQPTGARLDCRARRGEPSCTLPLVPRENQTGLFVPKTFLGGLSLRHLPSPHTLRAIRMPKRASSDGLDVGMSPGFAEVLDDVEVPAKRRPWSPDEDEHLRELVDQYGIKSWAAIATNLKNRNGKQCRERWRNHLRPQLNKGDWSAEEDVEIWDRVQEMGTKWAQVPFARTPSRACFVTRFRSQSSAVADANACASGHDLDSSPISGHSRRSISTPILCRTHAPR